jgi:hypothetical protein
VRKSRPVWREIDEFEAASDEDDDGQISEL